MGDPVRLTAMLTPETARRKGHSDSPGAMCDTILPNTPLSGSEQTENEVSQPQWPEKGDPWNEGDNDMDCELQQMAEEDEMIDLYNEETFGMDLDSEDTVAGGDSSRPLLQFGETPPVPPVPHISPPPTPRSLSPSPPKQHRPQYVPACPAGQRGRGPRGQRGGQRKPQMFEDPAVMRTVEGRPSIKSLDSSIVECGTALSWSGWDENDWMSPSYRRTRKTSGSILQDNAIVYMIDGQDGRGHHPNSKFLVEPPYPFPSFRGRRGSPRRPYYNRSFAPRGTPQMNTVMPQSPLLSRQPLTPRQHYNQNQTGGFRFPLGRPCSPSSRSMAPKIMQLRFGTNSPRPSPVYSPSSNPVQRFSYPGPVTQLHPQHKRQIIQKFRTIQRKPERWDPYCDLMTAKEKEWIIRLQMIQLQSENPYREDYYYQEYYRRLEAKITEEELGIRTKKELPKLTTPYITKPDTYTPVVHIEGSLGQVAVSTCYSPRRAIGAVHAAKVTHKVPNEEQKDTRQQRLDLLNKIEQLFIVLLEVEDSERVKTSVLTEAEETKQRENTQRKVKHIYSELQDPDTLELGEEFLPCLLISKGKKLLARLIKFLDHDSTLLALRAVSSHLHTLMARDTDESLPVLFPPLRLVIGGLTFSQLVGVLKILTTSESLTTYECLTLACQNKFGLSLLYGLLSQGERLLSSGAPLEPSIGDFETWTDTIFQVAGQLSQCSLVEPLFMPPNLLTLFCRYLDKRTVHQLKSNIESATGFLALAS